MDIRRLRIVWDAERSDAALTSQTKSQDHHQWQCQAVRSQLHGLPTRRLIPQLPAIGIATQTAKRLWMCQQDLSRQQPNAMRQAQREGRQTGPDGYRKKKQ
jgi:hypothetical protein